MNVLDLFCGVGGFSKGLQDSGLNIIGACDIWESAVNNYNKNISNVDLHKAVCADLTKLSPEEFENKHLKNNSNKIDIIVGGPPCQSFSIAGKRDTNDPRNTLFMEFVKYINYFKPTIFIMENVFGILSKKKQAQMKKLQI